MKKILGFVAALSVFAAMALSVHANEAPTVIVDERELVFVDQAPVIVEETGRTLIPIRFVLESAGARVKWDGETKTVTVHSGDNRNTVELTIGSDEMKMTYMPSVTQIVSDVKKLDQAPVIMNDRTMIPVRAVLEAIGAEVDWDEENRIINVTSRAYVRYLRDMGVEGYEVNYPLSEGPVDFDKAKEWTGEEPYDPKKDITSISISTEAETVKKGETFDVYVNLANIDKVGEGAYFSTMSFSVKYDKSKVKYKEYIYVDGGTEHSAVLDAVNPQFREDTLKMASIVTLGGEDTPPTPDGAVAKLTFEALTDEEIQIELSTRSDAQIGKDISLTFTVDGKYVTIDDAHELHIDTTPVVVNK